ncbi:MAG: hypothetical protein P8K83_02845, partial [Woeseiaceae bacterium]|nr:hypothetical protein [Woeseiaceae bacterium]
MSASDVKKIRNQSDMNDIVQGVRQYLATLPAKDGLDLAIEEGEQIAAIIEPLGLPAKIVAA